MRERGQDTQLIKVITCFIILKPETFVQKSQEGKEPSWPSCTKPLISSLVESFGLSSLHGSDGKKFRPVIHSVEVVCLVALRCPWDLFCS